MDFRELNRNRHAVKRFTGAKIPVDAIKELIDTAHYAPSGINMQSWHFAIVDSDQKRQEVAGEGRGMNGLQIEQAPGLVVLFSDTEIGDRLQSMGNTATPENDTHEKWLDRLNAFYVKDVETYTPQYKSDYLSLNSGLIAMNLMYAIYDAGYAGNFILGFNKTPKINEILDIDLRYRPELIIVLGRSDEKGEPHYRLPLDEIIDVR